MVGGFGVIPRALDCERTEALADGESLELVREDSDKRRLPRGRRQLPDEQSLISAEGVLTLLRYTRTRKTRVVALAHPRRTLERCVRRQLQLHLPLKELLDLRFVGDLLLTTPAGVLFGWAF